MNTNINITGRENLSRKAGEEPSDEQLIAQFQQGDEYAYILLVKRYSVPLMNYIYRFVGDKNDAEDILQETFLRLYKNKDYYREIARFSTWIYTIAGNLSKTHIRKKKRYTVFSIQNFLDNEKDYELPDKEILPDKKVNDRITDNEILLTINRLSLKFKQIIILRDIQGFSYGEISHIVKIPIGTVKSRVNRARIKIQQDLAKQKIGL